jgi:hypothetical protein
MYRRSTTPLPCPVARRPMPGGYVVQDANGRALAYLSSRDNEAEARQAKDEARQAKDEARRIAINVAQLPELLGKAGRTGGTSLAGCRGIWRRVADNHRLP